MELDFASIIQDTRDAALSSSSSKKEALREIGIEPFNKVLSSLDNIIGVDSLPGRGAIEGEIEGLPKDLRAAFKRTGVNKFYSHQIESYDALSQGKSIVLATPTASGKTNCYTPAIFESVLKGEGTTLLIYPLKALISDQMGKFRRINEEMGGVINIQQITGDVSREERQRMFAEGGHPDIICINPDVLHHLLYRTGSYSGWAGFRAFLSKLKYVVIDEVHSYLGSFGSHTANLMRRVRAGVEASGGDAGQIQWICSTATIGNPQEFCANFTGQKTEKLHLIEESGAAIQPKTIVRLRPSHTPNFVAMDAAMQCLEAGLTTLLFVNSRKTAKTLYQMLVARHYLASQIAYFHGSLPDRKRAAIIEGLDKGKIKIIIATNALEAGIDIADLDAVILRGFAGSLMSHRQRMGRCGRVNPGLVIFIPSADDPLDSFYSNHPQQLIQGQVESAQINPDYPSTVAQHIVCGAAETEIAQERLWQFGEFGEVISKSLMRQGKLFAKRNGNLFAKGYPHADVSIRGGMQRTVTLRDPEGEIIEEMSLDLAYREIHLGAIYETQEDGNTQRWKITEFDEAALSATADTFRDDNFYTESLSELEVIKHTILGDHKVFDVAEEGKIRVSLWWGQVISKVTGYKEMKKQLKHCCVNRNCRYYNNPVASRVCKTCGKTGETKEVIETIQTIHFEEPLATKMPVPIAFVEFNPDLSENCDKELDKIYDWLEKNPQPGLFIPTVKANFLAAHSLSHLLIKAIPMMMLASQLDLSSLTLKNESEVSPAGFYLYDTAEGGNGCSQATYENFEVLCQYAVELASDCECKVKGCPKCLYMSKCPERNEGVNKLLGATLLKQILNQN